MPSYLDFCANVINCESNSLHPTKIQANFMFETVIDVYLPKVIMLRSD